MNQFGCVFYFELHCMTRVNQSLSHDETSEDILRTKSVTSFLGSKCQNFLLENDELLCTIKHKKHSLQIH